MRFVFRCLACIILVTAAGCRKPDVLNRGGKVTGTAQLDGRPIPGGVIQFYSPDGAHAPQANVKPDGTYLVMEPPLGPCKVVVRTSHLKHLAGRTPPMVSSSVNVDVDTATGYAAVPARYED